MSTFVRNILGIVFVAGLSVMIGCATTQSGGKQSNVFSLPKATHKKKEEERATATSMEEFLSRPRVSR